MDVAAACFNLLLFPVLAEGLVNDRLGSPTNRKQINLHKYSIETLEIGFGFTIRQVAARDE